MLFICRIQARHPASVSQSRNPRQSPFGPIWNINKPGTVLPRCIEFL